MRIVVVGAGVGGLSAAALLRKAGHDVVVLEAHVYAGGCAGTFFRKGFRFDAGATLAGGFHDGGPHDRLARILGDLRWPVHPVDPAWAVHLPGAVVTQWADAAKWREERRRALPGTERFWSLQGRLAELSWDISSRPFPWPPGRPSDVADLVRALRPSTLGALPHLVRTAADLLPPSDATLRAFVDAQLLIAAQCTSERAHALYACAALDLPRRGVCHVDGGMGGIASTLVEWLGAHGARVLFKHPVDAIDVEHGRVVRVRSRDRAFDADAVLANLTPWALRDLLGTQAPRALVDEVDSLDETWSAFMVYLGVDAAKVDLPAHLHHQVVVDPSLPLGEGNSVFISISGEHDAHRAPAGRRAVTISTHTRPGPWWDLWTKDRAAYDARKALYVDRITRAVERAVPGLFAAAEHVFPATPLSFARFTRRPRGMVGGFPQESLFAARGPRTGVDNLFLVGDSIFPGQSTAGVTLGAMRVARLVDGHAA